MTVATTEELRLLASSDNTNELTRRLARECLANREAQPVALVDRRPAASGGICWQHGGKDLAHGTELFTAPPAPAVPDGYCVMPLTLTAANGAKGALSGEFKVSRTVICHECGGEGCDDCADAGEFEEEITVPWDTIKDIYRAAVDACRAATLAQPVSKRYTLPPHLYRELVNSLRDTAVKFSGTEQLRERLNTALSQFIEPDHPHTRKTAPEVCRDDA